MAPIVSRISQSFGFGNRKKLRGASGPKNIQIYLWGGFGTPGRGGAPGGGGWVQIQGTANPGTVIGYIVGSRDGARNFYTGGGGSRAAGGFSAAFVGPVDGTTGRTYVLGVAGGAGGGGNDGYDSAQGGAGGGPSGTTAVEIPDFGLRGGGATQNAGGGGGSGASSGGQWLGGNGASPTEGGGGGGGWYGGGGGGTNGGYDAGGGGGSGYVNSGTVTQPGFGSFTITSTTNLSGNGAPGSPSGGSGTYNNPSPYPNAPGTTGKVLIVVNNVVVVDDTSAPPGSAVETYTII
jgi:hypothetical protein